VEPLTVGLAFRQPVSASSIPADVSSAEHAEFVDNLYAAEPPLQDLPPLPPDSPSDYDLLAVQEVAHPVLPEDALYYVERPFQMSDWLGHDPFPGFSLLRNSRELELLSVLPQFPPSNSEHIGHLMQEIASSISLPYTVVLAYLAQQVLPPVPHLAVQQQTLTPLAA